MKRLFILFMFLFFGFGFSGCRSNDPIIKNPIVYTHQYDTKNKEIVLKAVEGTEFVFVKKGNIYFLKKKSEVNKNNK